VRTTSEVAQRAIAEAALATFRSRGYGLATLEEIGAQVGLTRGAVLHHFHSKATLLKAVVGPWTRALGQFLTAAGVDDQPTASQRLLRVTEFANMFFAHRGPVQLLANDISARVQLGLDDQWLISERLINTLVGTNAGPLARIKVIATIGALIQPMSCAWIDLEDATTRAELIETAATVIEGPQSRGSTTRPRNARRASMAKLSSLAQVVAR
jgi:AcrR family transcriptional regulator